MCTVFLNNARIQAVCGPGQYSSVLTFKMTGGLGFDSRWRQRFFSLCPDVQGYSASLFKGYVGTRSQVKVSGTGSWPLDC